MADNTPPYPYTEFTGTADTTGDAIPSVDTVVPAFNKSREDALASDEPEGMPYGVQQNDKGVFIELAPDGEGNYVHDGVTYQTAAQKVAAANS